MHTLLHRADLAELKQRFSLVQADDHALWGVLLAGEMVCHLRGAFRMAMGQIPVGPVDVDVPRSLIKFVALRVPLRWVKNYETVPSLKRGMQATQTSLFEADHADALAELDRFRRTDPLRDDHPFLGPMSFEDWMRWGYLHTDHHLRQFGR